MTPSNPPKSPLDTPNLPPQDTRRKQKLLLSQLRVLKLLLGVIESPGLPPAPTSLREPPKTP